MGHDELLEIVKQLAGTGHQFEWDPPAALASLRGRWTCSWCGDAVLMRNDESCYGAAVGSNCVPRPEIGQVWESVESGMQGLQVKVVEDLGAQFVTTIVKVPFGLRSYYSESKPLIIHRSRLRYPEAYSYGYKLVKDGSADE